MINLVELYLERMKKMGVIPNFFISKEYLSREDIIVKVTGNWIWAEDEKQCVFPPLPLKSDSIKKQELPSCPYWAGFPEYFNPENPRMEFFDYQYIYDPRQFNNLSGGKWKVFRKNTRKFERLNSIRYTSFGVNSDVNDLLSKWLENRIETVLDAEFIVQCILNPKDNYIRYLYVNDSLVAINYADENYKYINYRFLICNKVPFADEYARLRFYLDKAIQNKNKAVNDGGTMGFEGLEKFKDKLNPIQKYKIYSLK